MQAFGYLRVSSPGQAKDTKDGFTRQEKAIQAYAKANGLKIAGVFKEDFTGTELDRPVLAKLMVSLEKNDHGVKTVIVESLDRLARSITVQENIVQDLQQGGFELISAVEGPDLASDDPNRELIRVIHGAMYQYQKRMLVLKLKAARERTKARTGRCEGRKPYGATEAEQALLRRMRAMRRTKRGGYKGMTYQAIADRLNTEGNVTRKGKPWQAAGVYQVLNRKAK